MTQNKTAKEMLLDLGYVALAAPEHGLKRMGLEKRAEVLIPGPIDFILVHIEYCLRKPTKFKLRPDDENVGFTREEIVKGVVEMYTRVYKVEDETKTVSPSLHRVGNVISLNRPATDGKYGIWMHDLADLCLHSATYDESTKEMFLGLDS
ncbi:hypothetical protein MNV49_007229 [Pseudohyphozyma bogoriensis]|nr:hypothetical protein MNV49_007229 [Pseudohyphozyma bogoriensis]